MADWLAVLVPLFKSLHLLMLSLWCGGLLALPLMLSRHDPAVSQYDYHLIRRASHLSYTLLITPAAVVTVITGTWLIFMQQVYVPWFYAKLLFVAWLVLAHAWMGHVMVTVAEKAGRHRPPEPWLPIAVMLTPILAILLLVLGKPDLSGVEFPQWLLEPRNGQLPFEIPKR